MSGRADANSIVAEFLDMSDSDIAAKRDEFAAMLKLIRRYRPVDRTTPLLEIGTGTGWFQILCLQEGIPASGLEIDHQLVAHARQRAARHGLSLDLKAGNLDDVDLGDARYDVVVATTTFEHVKDWRGGLAKVYRALRPGGAFFFCSTNKFSFTNTEYDFPLYGWYPDAVRYRLRQYLQGPDVMQWGIDFNQFTHPQLRRAFTQLGFRHVYDRVDALDPDNLAHPTWKKRLLLKVLKRVPGARSVAMTFVPTTLFVCVK